MIIHNIFHPLHASPLPCPKITSRSSWKTAASPLNNLGCKSLGLIDLRIFNEPEQFLTIFFPDSLYMEAIQSFLTLPRLLITQWVFGKLLYFQPPKILS